MPNSPSRIAVVMVLVGLLLGSCSGGPPKIMLEDKSADLGVVTNGELRTVEIGVDNKGRGDLVIVGVSTSCGCTTAIVDPTTIGPGETGKLTVTYDSGAHGPDFTGTVMRQVFIDSNDPDQPEIEFRITAEVVAP